MMLRLAREHLEEMFAHARETSPAECCGLVGGSSESAQSVYRLRNVARVPLSAYEAAPEELFAAQKLMRERGEQMLAIYHSHPRSEEPLPSAEDVRLAYYPSAFYLIIGLSGAQATLRAFRINERLSSWQPVQYSIAEP